MAISGHSPCALDAREHVIKVAIFRRHGTKTDSCAGDPHEGPLNVSPMSRIKEAKAIILMHFSRKKILRRCEDTLRRNSFLNEMTLDGLPHPAIVIDKRKTIIVANRIAREMGAKPGKNCGRDFCANSRVFERNNLHSQPREESQAQFEPESPFCLAEKALMFKEVTGRREARLFDRLWDVWWLPISGGLLLHYWVDITDRKRAEEALIRNERIKALGEMALGMAHNFNNTLQVIVSGARLGLLEAGSGNL
ncbi:MAG: hypothetical protein HY912_09560, partial [Desulfomonile tiedjei]|nr:hypothetical protein [Desulfomonile tiedjei]